MNTSVQKGIRNPEGEAMEQKRPGGEMKPANTQEPTKSQLLPASFNWDQLRGKPYFWPAMASAAFVVVMAWLLSNPELAVSVPKRVGPNSVVVIKIPYYLFAIALLISAATLFVAYKICGKRMNLWLYGGMAVLVAYLTGSEVWNVVSGFIRGTFGSGLPQPGDGFLIHYWKMFISAGVTEELFKAIPLLALAVLGASKLSPWNERFGLREPLDGILLGVAAGVGFAFQETMFQYFRDALLEGVVQKSTIAATFKGAEAVTLLIIRLVSDIFGHSAYAGYFGYFIGLACLYPHRRWKLLAIGLVSAAAVHALWNSSGKLGVFFYFLVAAGSFVLLAGAVIKARQLSVNRSQLVASELIDRIAKAGALAGAAGLTGNAVPANAPGAPTRSETWTDAVDVLAIEIGTARVPVSVGARLYERQAPGTHSSRGDGIVAEVSANPNDPGMLGLKNLSNQLWEVTTDRGERRELAPGRSIRIARGMKIQLGDLIAEVK